MHFVTATVVQFVVRFQVNLTYCWLREGPRVTHWGLSGDLKT